MAVEGGKRMTDRQREIVLALAGCKMNASEAGKKIFLHRNTVLYHGEQIKLSTGLDPFDFYDLCKLLEMAKEEDDDKL